MSPLNFISIFPATPAFSSSSLLRRDKWLISLRWFAILGLLLGVALLYSIKLGPEDSVLWMGMIGLIMIVLNLVYLGIASAKHQFGRTGLVLLLNAQMVIDLLLLTILVHLTGAEESPLILFYVFHIILASIIFPGGFSYYYSFLVIFLFTSLLGLGHSGIVEHQCFFKEIHLGGDPRFAVVIWFVFTATMILAAYLAQNVTERHRHVREKLEVANRKLQEVNKTKTTFFRYASHEMKAPVATIQSTLMVIDEVLGDKIDDRVRDMVKRAVGKTSEIIEMLKDLADLTYGNLQEQQEKAPVDLGNLLEELTTDMLPGAERKQQKISYKGPDTPCMFDGNLDALKKVFNNLISNAIRYTQDGGNITVELIHKPDVYCVEISDDGPGIPESEQVNVFKEFYRTPAAKKQISEGTGLGLSIVERMVELHAGSIDLISNGGRGSKFIVELPIGVSE